MACDKPEQEEELSVPGYIEMCCGFWEGCQISGTGTEANEANRNTNQCLSSGSVHNLYEQNFQAQTSAGVCQVQSVQEDL